MFVALTSDLSYDKSELLYQIYKAPDYTEIKTQLDEWLKATANVRTAEQAKEFVNSLKKQQPVYAFTTNIGNFTDNTQESLDVFLNHKESKAIEYIYYQYNGKNLCEIYDYFNGNPFVDICFDYSCLSLYINKDKLFNYLKRSNIKIETDYIPVDIVTGYIFSRLSKKQKCSAVRAVVKEEELNTHQIETTSSKTTSISFNELYDEKFYNEFVSHYILEDFKRQNRNRLCGKITTTVLNNTDKVITFNTLTDTLSSLSIKAKPSYKLIS